MSKLHRIETESATNQMFFSDKKIIEMANKLAQNVYDSPSKTRQAAFDIVFSKENPSNILFLTQFIKSLTDKLMNKVPDDWNNSQLSESILKFLDSNLEAMVLFQELTLIKIVTKDELSNHLLLIENGLEVKEGCAKVLGDVSIEDMT